MAKKVDCSFMKFAYTDADWQSCVIDPKGTLVGEQTTRPGPLLKPG